MSDDGIIKFLSDLWYYLDREVHPKADELYEKLKALIKRSKQPVNQWIEASERLPEKNGRYLVIEKGFYNRVGICSMREGKFDISITHWMPLPELP